MRSRAHLIASLVRPTYGPTSERSTTDPIDLGNGWTVEPCATYISDAGHRTAALHAVIMDGLRGKLAALQPHLGVCEHGRGIAQAIELGELEWMVNDYVCDAETEPVLVILWGRHAGLDLPEGWCCPWGFDERGILFRW